MKVRFLGTGTSGGVPLISCKCEVCTSINFQDQRLRSSILISQQGKNYIIDAGPDFRQQALKANLNSLEAIIYTHEHKDHTGGLDDIRPLNYLNGKKVINLFGQQRVLDQLKREFHYIFEANTYQSLPLVNINHIENKPFTVDNLNFIPIQAMHHKLPVFGYRINDFAYLTDTNFISEEEKEKLKGLKVLVLNALQKTPHVSHFTLDEAIELALELKADKTYFTHMSHKMGLHAIVNKELPENMELAYDDLEIDLDD